MLTRKANYDGLSDFQNDILKQIKNMYGENDDESDNDEETEDYDDSTNEEE